jgi:hypothetical protein
MEHEYKNFGHALRHDPREDGVFRVILRQVLQSEQ